MVVTISLLKKEFLLAFFDIMINLLLHVVDELEICELVHSCWMYPVEPMMKALKGYVHNMSQLKGSMAEGYILDETMGFVTKYLQEFYHVSRRIWDVKEKEGVVGEVLEGAVENYVLSPKLQDLAHNYVFINTEIMSPWI